MAKSSGDVRGSLAIYDKIMSMTTDILKDGYSKKPPIRLGKIEQDLKKYAEAHGINLGNGEMYLTQDRVAHTLRDLHSNKAMDISPQELASFPARRFKMSLYHDTSENKFIYFDGKAKYVVHPNLSFASSAC